MEKQSYELINGVARYYKVHSLIYDNRTSKLKFLLTIPWKVKKILKENPNISVVHFNDGLMAFFSMMIKKITNVPVLATLHGLDLVFPSKLFQRLVVDKFKKLDGIIAVSQATAKEAIIRGFKKERVFVVRNGVDTDLAHVRKRAGFRKVLEEKIGIPLHDKKILISVGRSVRRKGFSWFMKKVLPRLDKNIIYCIIGPPQKNIRKINFILNLLPERVAHLISLGLGLGIDEIDIQDAMQNPEIRDRAFYLGKLPFVEMVQALKHADIFVMPNIKVVGDAEGFGLVALEASVTGVPVVASSIEGITCAVIDRKNGHLVPPEKEEAWIEKINKLLLNGEALKRFGEEAKQYTIDNYEWNRMADGYISIFKKYHFQYCYSEDKSVREEEDGLSRITDTLMMDEAARRNA
jgi:phosphatidylinositol alpha-1,6-mannosyltransferase